MKTKLYLVLFAVIFVVSLSATPVMVSHQDATMMSYSYTHGILDGFYYEYCVDGGDAVIQHDGSGDDVPISNMNGFGNVLYYMPPGDAWMPNAVTFNDPPGGGLPEAVQGDLIYFKVYDAPTPSAATNYTVSQYPGDFYTVTTSPIVVLEAGLDFTWSTWFPISTGEPIDPEGGTVVFPGGGGSITFPAGNSGTIDLTFDSTQPPPGIPVTNPQTLWWDFDTSGATITVWPVRLRLEFPLTAGVTYASSAVLHYTDAAWWGLVHPTIPVHPNNVGQNFDFAYDYTDDPSWIEFDTWTLSDFGLDSDNPLPITLTNFAAEFVANNLNILWTTQSESNNMGWNIYRGESNTALEEDNTILINGLDLIEGAGTTSEPTDYTFQDQHPVVELNTYWYWLESVSYSNDTEIYTPISFTIPEGAIIPVLPTTTLLKGNYPNPFNPSTFIQFDIKEGETGELTIFNIKGQVIESMRFDAGEHDKEWDAKSVVSGVYFYKLTSESYTCTKKMLLLK